VLPSSATKGERNVSTEIQAAPVQEELLLSGLSWRAALADIAVMLLLLGVAGAACTAWETEYQRRHPLSKDILRSWVLPVAIGDLFALALAAVQTRQGRLRGERLASGARS
jgi:hypothetical protein